VAPIPAGQQRIDRSRAIAGRPLRTRARRGEGERLRDEILAAAERLLLDTGHESALSIRAIADAVGVTAPSIYLHFADRNELLFAVCERHFEALAECLDASMVGVTDPVERIRRLGAAYIRFGVEHPEPYRIMFMARADAVPEGFTEEHLRTASCFGHLLTAVQAAIDAGRYRVDDAYLAATLLWTAVHGMTALLVAKPDLPWPDLDKWATMLLDMCEHGLVRQKQEKVHRR
jgi:AcrR family transcriptional regulator